MALVNIINVTVMDNPTSFTNPFQFEITFECLQELADDLEWKVVYVASAEDDSADQTLEEVMVGPVSIGINRFVLQADAPNPANILNSDLIGVTVALVTCSYMDNKFVQIGYYVSNEYIEEYDPENIPNPIDVNKLRRTVLSDQPRVTRYNIDWSGAAGGNANLLDADDGPEEQVDEDDENVLDLANADDEEDDEEEDEEEDNDDQAEVDLEMMEDEDGYEGDEVSGEEEEEQQQQQSQSEQQEFGP
mmetsp:Transcript_6020/g.9969  ORF Transcript_6020/g.9969 Transcript_6020/m.9969 type:complete len:247 (-) Transcript_6020:2115-2855(-)